MIDIKKRIFITGVTGFVGANLLHRLILLGAKDVHVLIRKNSDTSRIDSVLTAITIHSFALENKIDTLENIKKIQPQIIYHVAAMGTAVGRKIISIDELIVTNTLGSIHLMDAAFEVNCECFVNTGSSSEYGNKDLAMLEGDILVPNNLYGISKAAATQYATYLKGISLFPIVTYRLFSVYGQLEDSKRLIPTLVQSYLRGIPPELSSPFFVRDFIHIDDVIDCYLEADIACSSNEDIFNIGSGVQSSITDVVMLLKKIFSSTLDPQYNQQNILQFEPKVWVSNNSKMRDLLHISPRSLYDGLLQIIDRV